MSAVILEISSADGSLHLRGHFIYMGCYNREQMYCRLNVYCPLECLQS